MLQSRLAWLAIATAHIGISNAQESGWQKGQVNATMCYWQQLRAAVVRDTVYMDGGYLWWQPGMADGTYGSPTQDGNPLGLVYTLNFSTPFDSTTNISSILSSISKAPNGGAANNLAPNYYDGGMLANDNEFFLYGGLPTRTSTNTPPRADDVFSYELYQYGPAQKPGWRPGYVNHQLQNDITRYVTYGGAASSPSENKAWYFAGQRSPTWGPIYYPSGNATLNPTNVSNTLITLDMNQQGTEQWGNKTLPEFIKGRANPELIWVPVGAQGILVALGGVVFPAYDNSRLKSVNEAQSQADSPKFMSTIDIYDIADDKWYQQPTIGGPGQLTQGCAVVAPAQDYSSYNIYYYGGYDGLHPTQDFNADVWILSLPSFMWMKVSSGTAARARAGHKCVMPYPDQMIVIGGYSAQKGINPTCNDGGILQVFNLTEGKWMDSYNPARGGQYGVPAMIHVMIGGTETGGATMSTPSPTGWADPDLAKVFQTAYPTGKLTHYYPYTPSGNNTRPDLGGGGGGSGGSGTPSWVAPTLGVVLGLVFITAVVVGILLWRRRKLLRKGSGSDAGAESNGQRIITWIRGQNNQNPEKAPTVTSDETRGPIDDVESRAVSTQPQMSMVSEMPDTPLYEMMDTSPRAELSDTGLTPVDIINKHSHFARRSPGPRSASPATHPSSFHSGAISQPSDHISTHSSIPAPRQGRGSFDRRPDSPSLGLVQGGTGPSSPHRPAPSPRVVSDVSGVSERDQSHLRQISDVSVSTGTGTAPASPRPENVGLARAASPLASPALSNAQISPPLPVSPPEVDGREAPDYMSVNAHVGRSLTSGTTNNPLRRSAFRESEEDLNEQKNTS